MSRIPSILELEREALGKALYEEVTNKIKHLHENKRSKPMPAQSMIATKADDVQAASNLTPAAIDITTIIGIILQIFQTIGKCSNPTPKRIHRMITNPGPLQRHVLRSVVYDNVHDAGVGGAVEHGIYAVGRNSTEQETQAMYEEAMADKGNDVDQ